MSDQSRRKILKSIAAGSGAIVAGKSLPESWSRPVVDSVMLPAHAQTSPAPAGCDTLAIPATDQPCSGYVTLTRYWYVDDSGSCPTLVLTEVEPSSANRIEIAQSATSGPSTVLITVRSGIQTTVTDQTCGNPRSPYTAFASSSVAAVGSTRRFQVQYNRSVDDLGAYLSEVTITPE